MDPRLREKIIEEVLRVLQTRGIGEAGPQNAPGAAGTREESPLSFDVRPQPAEETATPPASLLQPKEEAASLPASQPAEETAALPASLPHLQDAEAMRRMQQATTARIGVGRCGPRLLTQTMLGLRADHAQAQDAVFADVSQELLDSLGLFTVQSLCEEKNTFLTRPDLGRKLSDAAVETIRARCVMQPDVQIFAADGLSSTAIEANLANILPVLTDALQAKGLSLGTPFFVRFGRVGVEDHVAEILGCKVVCVLIGERPGLATAESMSAYTVYNAYVGMPESRRTVISNIHKDGIAAVEAGAYLADVIEDVLNKKASGVELQK